MNVETARMDRDHLDPTRRRCSRRTALRAGAAGIAATTLVAAGRRTALAQSATPAASPCRTSGDFAGLVDIGGRKLYLECHGDGQPHRRAGGRRQLVRPLLERRPAPPRCAADHGAARGGQVHPRLRLRPPGDLCVHQ